MLNKLTAVRDVTQAGPVPSSVPASPAAIATPRNSFDGLLPPRRNGTLDSSNATLRSPDPNRHGHASSRDVRSDAHPDGAPARLTAVHERHLRERFDVDVGHASGAGLNCLLDSVLQLFHNQRIARDQQAPEWMRTIARILRDILIEKGAASENAFIDVYGGTAQYLAETYRVRIQVIEQRDGAAVLHPAIGDEGHRLLQVLHTVDHFQPLWPRRRDQ